MKMAQAAMAAAMSSMAFPFSSASSPPPPGRPLPVPGGAARCSALVPSVRSRAQAVRGAIRRLRLKYRTPGMRNFPHRAGGTAGRRYRAKRAIIRAASPSSQATGSIRTSWQAISTSTGVMSTPPMGGIAFWNGLRKGRVRASKNGAAGW